MSERNHGGPAFPVEDVNTPWGMTMRDYMAAKAMQAIVGSDKWDREICETASRNEVTTDSVRAHFAYEIADAMLAERGKQE